MCVNSVCLTSFNHSGLYVFSLGNMEERGERLVMSQQPIRSAAASGNRKRKWPTCCRNHSLVFKNILLGAEIVTPGLIIFGLSRSVEKQAFLISGAGPKLSNQTLLTSAKAIRRASSSPVGLSANQSGQKLCFPIITVIKTRPCFPPKEHTYTFL